MDIDQSAQAIESQLIALRWSAAQLDQRLQNQAVKDYFVRRATDLLDDVEAALRHAKSKDSTHPWLWFYMADFSLVEAERRLKHAQERIAKFGVDLEAIA